MAKRLSPGTRLTSTDQLVSGLSATASRSLMTTDAPAGLSPDSVSAPTLVGDATGAIAGGSMQPGRAVPLHAPATHWSSLQALPSSQVPARGAWAQRFRTASKVSSV